MTRILDLVGQLLSRSRRLLRAGQHAAARALLRRLEGMPLPPARAGRVQLLLAEGLLRRGRRPSAVRRLRRAAELRPDDAQPHFLLGLACAADPAAAKEHFLRSLELRPDHARCRGEAGLAAVRAGEADEGIPLLREAVRRSPGDVRLVGLLVQGLKDAGLPDEARSAIHAARFAAPRCPRLQAMLLGLDASRLRRRQATTPRPDPGPVLLPFLRVEGETPRVRRDAPATLPGPHLLRARRRALRRPS